VACAYSLELGHFRRWKHCGSRRRDGERLFLNAHDYTCGGRTDAIGKEMGYKPLQSRLSDSFRCDLIVSVAALLQTSNLGVGGSNPSERANSGLVQPGHMGDRTYL
jgi:hypothetical protein